MRKQAQLLSVFFLLSPPLYAITLSVTDSHIPSSAFGTLDTAGDYFASSLESSATAATASIGDAPLLPLIPNLECGGLNPAWKLSANLNTAVSGLTLRVKRTNNGSGGLLYGGTSYITLDTFTNTLFCGSGNVSNIDLQFQVDGIDINDGYGLKTWDINYTVETL